MSIQLHTQLTGSPRIFNHRGKNSCVYEFLLNGTVSTTTNQHQNAKTEHRKRADSKQQRPIRTKQDRKSFQKLTTCEVNQQVMSYKIQAATVTCRHSRCVTSLVWRRQASLGLHALGKHTESKAPSFGKESTSVPFIHVCESLSLLFVLLDTIFILVMFHT